MDAYQHRLRAEFSDTAWAFFPVSTGGGEAPVEDASNADTVLRLVSNLTPDNNQDNRVFTALAHFLTVDSKNNIGAAMSRLDNGFFLAWGDTPSDARVYPGYFVSNIAEYQAKELAAKMGMKSWIHSNAYHDNGERVPADSTNCKFMDCNLFAEDGHITYKGERVGLNGGADVTKFLKRLGLAWAPGILGVFRTAPRIFSQMKRMFPGVPDGELPAKLHEYVLDKRERGVEDRSISQALGVTGDEIIVAVLPIKD